MDEENLENIDPEEDLSKPKTKKKILRKVKKKKSRKNVEEEKEPSQEDIETLNKFQACSLAKRKSSCLSLEVEKMSKGKPLSHFQAMAMLRKALVASFIATPNNSKSGTIQMKSTENRRLSAEGANINVDVHEIESEQKQDNEIETVPVNKVKDSDQNTYTYSSSLFHTFLKE